MRAQLQVPLGSYHFTCTHHGYNIFFTLYVQKVKMHYIRIECLLPDGENHILIIILSNEKLHN